MATDTLTLTVPGTRLDVESWMTPAEAQFKYPETPTWPVAKIIEARAKAGGRSFHVGGGQWLMVCPHCDAYTLTWGSLPIYYAVGPHMVEAHDAKVPGINVGMLA